VQEDVPREGTGAIVRCDDEADLKDIESVRDGLDEFRGGKLFHYPSYSHGGQHWATPGCAENARASQECKGCVAQARGVGSAASR
jgi:hypothetical protein